MTTFTTSSVTRITAEPPSTRNERTYVLAPSPSVVTVQPSSVVVVLSAAVVVRAGDGAADVRVGSVVRLDVRVVVALGSGSGSGSAVGVVLGGGAGAGAASPESRSWSTETSELSSGVAVRSTGSMATEASATLETVAAHQPSTGAIRGDRTGP
ncbi:hypothetical protein GCM10020358_20820 [Amorphoplanes nipponensis]|uniref:Uncharacterized protein n=1 Tax=Actinoplanes nipponensis TaxID=135950 RepID=A0A919JEQ2_9ACTN|nr:hypothetical protein Ani05nite_28670 [Actinoplanes nipponensis]